MSSLAKYAHGLESRIARMKEKGEEAMSHGLQMAEVAGASAAAGYANAKFGTNGELQFKGVPADLLGGIGLHALAFLGGAGKYGEHAHNLADGLIAAYAYRAGVHAATP
jgi:hypothetical protein